MDQLSMFIDPAHAVLHNSLADAWNQVSVLNQFQFILVPYVKWIS